MTQIIDFEEITTNDVAYFLYRNDTEGARDVNAGNNYYITPDVGKACRGTGFQLMKDLDRITSIRNTLDSYFMIVSEGYILALMLVLTILAVHVIPEMLKEHHIPTMFRVSSENMFSVIMRARIFAYLYFIILAGCMPSLSMIYVDHICLHTNMGPTESKTTLDIGMVDFYAVCLAMFVWFISVPMVLFVIFAYFKDASRYMCIPMLVASLVFVLVCSILSLVCIGFTIVHGNSVIMQATTIVNCAILFWTMGMNEIYRINYSKRDLLMTDE